MEGKRDVKTRNVRKLGKLRTLQVVAPYAPSLPWCGPPNPRHTPPSPRHTPPCGGCFVHLQPGDVALFVPSSLIVTLERVLGDETIGKRWALCSAHHCQYDARCHCHRSHWCAGHLHTSDEASIFGGLIMDEEGPIPQAEG